MLEIRNSPKSTGRGREAGYPAPSHRSGRAAFLHRVNDALAKVQPKRSNFHWMSFPFRPAPEVIPAHRRRWANAKMSGKNQVNRSIMPRNRSANDVTGMRSHTQAGVLIDDAIRVIWKGVPGYVDDG